MKSGSDVRFPSMLTLDRLTKEDGPRLRAIRLRALTDSPDAFGALCQPGASRPTAAWDHCRLPATTFLNISAS